MGFRYEERRQRPAVVWQQYELPASGRHLRHELLVMIMQDGREVNAFRKIGVKTLWNAACGGQIADHPGWEAKASRAAAALTAQVAMLYLPAYTYL